MPFLQYPSTFGILIVTVLVSVMALYQVPSLIERWGFRPSVVLRRRQWYRFLTAALVHVALWHLALNMVTLYFFGPLLERRLGSRPFLILYVGSALAAHGMTYFMRYTQPEYIAVGASGAISGVLLGYSLFEPLSLIYFFGIVPIPAIVFAAGFIVISASAMHSGKRIAHEAHLGGALGGVLMTVVLEPEVVSVFLGNFGL